MAPRHGASLVRHERGRTSLLEGLRLGHGYCDPNRTSSNRQRWRREVGKYHSRIEGVGSHAARIVFRKVHSLA